MVINVDVSKLSTLDVTRTNFPINITLHKRSEVLSHSGHSLLTRGCQPIGIGGYVDAHHAVRGTIIGQDIRGESLEKEYCLPNPTTPHYEAFIREALDEFHLDGTAKGLTLLVARSVLQEVLKIEGLRDGKITSRGIDVHGGPDGVRPYKIENPLTYISATYNNMPVKIVACNEMVLSA